LHQVVVEHAETMFAQAREQSDSGHGYPGHVEREFRRYVDCGILARGFVRVRCGECGTDELVAFSCKGKAVCPSCAGRRMNDLALRLCEQILPVAPYRQWVFSFPWRIRVALAYDRTLLSQVLAICVRKVFAFQRTKARRLGITNPQTLAACFVQRFGSLLQLNPHGHAVFPDGVFVKQPDQTMALVELGPPTPSELSAVGLAIVKAVARLLARADNPLTDDDVASMLALSSAAVEAPSSNHRDHDTQHDRRQRQAAKLAAVIDSDLGRFSIHAGTAVAEDDRPGLLRLIRYAARPPLAQQRLSITPSGKVCYRLRKPYYTGQNEVVLDPVAFLARMAALVPPLRQNQVRYYGLLASRAASREQVVGLGLDSDPDTDSVAVPNPLEGDDEPVHHNPQHRYEWAKLLAKVFQHQALVCPRCKRPRTIVAAVTNTAAAQKILRHLGLSTELPELAGARDPPQLDFADLYDN
jgi:hypothetical protein